MLGVWADFDALVVRPCPPSDWKEYEVHKRWRGRRIYIHLRRSGPPGCRITLNGQIYTERIPLAALSESTANRVEVEFG